MKTTTRKNFLSADQAFRKHNDGQNQNIKAKFVEREIYCNVNTLVEYCLLMAEHNSQAPFGYDDIENFYTVNTENVIREIVSDFDDKADEFKAYSNDRGTFNRRVKNSSDFNVFLNSLDNDELQEFCEQFDYEFPESEPVEIFEWWAISGWLYDKLNELGYPVLDAGSCKVWGRTTTGQAILLDGVIGRICANMEILEGQANSWANKQ